MEKIKEYIDSRYRTVDASSSDSDFHFGLKEAFEAPDNTVCYIDDISIPHTWRTIESHNNNMYLALKRYLPNSEITTFSHNPYVLAIPEGGYNGNSLAFTIQEIL